MAVHLDESLRMRRLARLVASAPSVLDLGWAQSPNTFLTNPHVVGFDLKVRPLPSNYHESLAGDVVEMRRVLANRSFDAIIAGEILEHLEDPHRFLRDCHALLNPGGLIALSTPNPNSIIEQLLTITLNRKLFYTTEHLCLYPQRWLIRMLDNCGFQNIELSSGGFPVPGFGLIPFPRPWCHQTIAVGSKPPQ